MAGRETPVGTTLLNKGVLMMQMKTMLMSALALGVLATGPALANDPSKDMSGNASGTVTFSSLDKDKSGTVSQNEFSDAGLDGATFAQLDIDRDGALTRSEVQSNSTSSSSSAGDTSTSSTTMTGSGTVNN